MDRRGRECDKKISGMVANPVFYNKILVRILKFMPFLIFLYDHSPCFFTFKNHGKYQKIGGSVCVCLRYSSSQCVELDYCEGNKSINYLV